MNLDDLWIGDRLILKKSGRIGSFEGIKNNKARIKLGSKILLVAASDLEIAPAENVSKLKELESELHLASSTNLEKRIEFVSEIDLHAEKLQPGKQHDNPIAILEFQLRSLRQFIDKAIALRVPKVTIIHGKGTGALRMEVMSIVESYPQKQSLFPINGDGATIVYLQYYSV